MSKLFILSILLLATTLATSTRILTDVTPLPDPIPIPATEAEATPAAVASATNAAVTPIPDSDVPPLTTTSPAANDVAAPVLDEPAPVIAPVPEVGNTDAPPLTTASPPTNAAATPVSDEPAPIDAPPLTTPTANPAVAPVPDEPAPVVAPVPEHPNSGTPPLTTPSGGGVAGAGGVSGGSPTFSFFMHDILGGSNPSGRAVAGIVANSDANNLPFSKNNNQFFPINGGVPLNTVNGVVNNNNLPFLVGLNGSPSNTVVQNNGNNVVSGGGSQPFVTAGQLPAGLTLQQLTFGSVTVVDNEITAGHELGSAVLGRAQGFYLTSSSDGSSHTLALTVMFHGGEVFDTVSFFGVHRTATPISHIAVVGGTGKYENAKGFAAIEALPQVDQHTTDGVETITHFTVYLTP
ncbi:dirigent protein 24-like [Salvia hispanica]|uniref:dirigent protein 24-like n=1 Tax=Salvia hispanica TaxID=49212 RepID=UPI002008EF66|nr:dirigent protein 24-like [Salvia hispanica]